MILLLLAMITIHKMVIQFVIVRAVVLQAALHDLSQTNFLHEGCTIVKSFRRDTFADSIFFHMLFSPETSQFSVEVTQRGIRSMIRFTDFKGPNLHHGWMMMELVLRDKLKVRYTNGSDWLTGTENKTMSREPHKTVRMRGGHFMEDCPEETPFWILEGFAEDQSLFIGENEETLSFFPNHPTKIYFTVGKEKLVFCWHVASNTTTVLSAASQMGVCDPLPAFTSSWLQLVSQASVFKISDPRRPEPLRSFHLDEQGGSTTFDSSSVNGATYVVHHLNGFPQQIFGATQSSRGSPTGTSLNNDVCVRVMLPVMIMLVVLLLVSGCAGVVFYQRWTKARKVLYMLRRQGDGSKQNNNTSNTTCEEGQQPIQGAPLPPARRPPKVSVDNLYMIPREMKANSEHMYEEVNWLSQHNSSGSHENSAFEQTKTAKQ